MKRTTIVNTTPGLILAKQKGKSKKKQFNKSQVSDAAAQLGSLGGLAGGPARAAVLTSKQRSAIARHAALIRWGQHSVYPS
jgi:hypothetical protein